MLQRYSLFLGRLFYTSQISELVCHLKVNVGDLILKVSQRPYTGHGKTMVVQTSHSLEGFL